MVSILYFTCFVNPPSHNKICFRLTGLVGVGEADEEICEEFVKTEVAAHCESVTRNRLGRVTDSQCVLFQVIFLRTLRSRKGLSARQALRGWFGCQGRSLGPYPRCFISVPGQVAWAIPPLFHFCARVGHLGHTPAVFSRCQDRSRGPGPRCSHYLFARTGHVGQVLAVLLISLYQASVKKALIKR